MAGKREFTALFEPDRAHLAGRLRLDEATTWSSTCCEDVKNRLSACSRPAQGRLGEVRVRRRARPSAPWACGAVDADDSDAVWLTATDFLTPTTLSLAEVGQQRRKC